MVPTWVPRPKYTLLTMRSSRAVREGSRAMISANWPACEWWLRRRSARAPWMLRNDASLGQASMRCRSSISLSTGLAAPAKIGGGVLKRKSTSPVPYVYRTKIRSAPSARNLFLGETLRRYALRFARLGDGGHGRADDGLSCACAAGTKGI